MPLKVYYEADADLARMRQQTIAVLGYGNQGRAHALNLRDSGCRVIVAQREGGANYQRAIDDGMRPVAIGEAAQQADVLIFALPDEAMGEIYASRVNAHLRAGQTLGFIHGFAIRFGLIAPPKDVDVVLVAPKGPGSLVRSAFEKGGGLTCLVAVHQDSTGNAKKTALAWGSSIGGGKGGMIETTFAAECETDLFGEQTVLCGGVIELMKAAYDVLVEAGYPAELAYYECIHEVKQIVDLQYAEGIAAMRKRISGTAAYGGLTVGARIVDERVRNEMRRVLAEVQSGEFARRWVDESRAGRSQFSRMMDAEASHPSEAAGRRVRELIRRSAGS